MKMTIIAAATMVLAGVSLTGAENLILNGDFETIEKKAKSSDMYIMEQIKGGWDLGKGPVAALPNDWRPNGGKFKLRIITVGENGENKDLVKSGKNSLQIEAAGGHMLNVAPIKPGEYEVSCWIKGSGTLMLVQYQYGINPETGKAGKFLETTMLISENASEEWKEVKKVVKFGEKEGAVQSTFAIAVTGGPLYLDNMAVVKVEPAKR